MMEREREKQEWLQNMRDLKEKAELDGCTFKPKLIAQEKKEESMRHPYYQQQNEIENRAPQE